MQKLVSVDQAEALEGQGRCLQLRAWLLGVEQVGMRGPCTQTLLCCPVAHQRSKVSVLERVCWPGRKWH